ncbi:MAG: DUF1565 domain-containing protein [Candidatus Cloacimonetes bacterium]|nr:DUF1565 domain-containing protein [Candidatus Cloacimonadota bacterium]
MKKIIILLGFIYILLNQLFAVTHTVGYETEYDYQSIQSAIDNAVNGDSIIVYPGIYYENINFLGKSLFLGSLYSLTADTSYVSQTIIDGQKQATVIALEYVDQATIEGFTVQNGKGTYGFDDYDYELDGCGGIYAYNSTLDLNYNIIKENFATTAGGIGIIESNAYLKGNQIFRNRATYNAGGIIISREYNGPITEVIFDPIEKNSVYFNVSQYYNDIYVNRFEEIDIYLKKSTFCYNTPYNIFVKPRDGMPTNINIDIEEGFFEEVNADLYVSVDGDDSNSGLSPEDPLRSITMAIFKQKEDSLNIKTIYVADGVHSEETGNIFPLKLKRYTKLIGESRDNTIIDCGGTGSGFVSGYCDIDVNSYIYPENIAIKNFSIRNTFNVEYSQFGGRSIRLLGKSYNNIYNIQNIKVDNTADESLGQGGIVLRNTDIVRVSDIYFKREVRDLFARDVQGITILGSKDGLLENIIIDGGNVGLEILTGYQSVHEYNRITVSNALLKNLSSQYLEDVDFSPYSVNVIRAFGTRENESEVYDDIRIINSTIYNNSGLHGIIRARINLNIDFYNCIIYGNTPYNTISLGHAMNGTLGGSVFSHNLFEHPSYGIVAVPLWDFDFINNIVGDPMFVGNGMYPEALSTGSPAINAGTLDIPDYEFPEYDIAGNPRIFDGQIDIGAYEYQSVTNNEIELPKPENKISFYPNPINLSKIKSNIANIDLEIAEAGDIHLAIYNIKGQRVKTLISGKTKVGGFNMFWDGLDDDKNFVSSGVYFIKAKINDKEIFKKFTIIK